MDSIFSPGRSKLGSPASALAAATNSMSAPIDTDTSTSLFRVSHVTSPTFADNPHASTTSASSSGALVRPFTAFVPSKLRFSTSASYSDTVTAASSGAPASSAFGPATSACSVLEPALGVLELSGKALDAVANTGISKLTQGVEILRIYVDVDDVPFALLDALLTAHPPTLDCLCELHICIQLHIRPALQDIQNSLGLKRAMMSTMRKWTPSSTLLKFYFPLPHVSTEAASRCINFEDYQDIDLWTAIAGLDESTIELTDILCKAEGRQPVTQGVPCAVTSEEGYPDDDGAIDLDDYL